MKTRRQQQESGNEKAKGTAAARNPSADTSAKTKGNAMSEESQQMPRSKGIPEDPASEDDKKDADGEGTSGSSPESLQQKNATQDSAVTSDRKGPNPETKKRRSPRTREDCESISKRKKKGVSKETGEPTAAEAARINSYTVQPDPHHNALSTGTSVNDNDNTSLPVKEVRATRSKHGGRSKHELDDPTLALITTSLENRRDDQLDEDDLVLFSIKMNRVAEQQVSTQQSMNYGKSAEESDSADSDHSSVFADCLDEEEDLALGHDLMKKLHSQIQSKRKLGGGNFGGPGTLERRTVQWVRKTAGLVVNGHQAKKQLTSRVSTRRFTRKQARANRQRKRERGLDIFVAAVAELEDGYGPFPTVSGSPKGKRKKQTGAGSRKRLKNEKEDSEVEMRKGRKPSKMAKQKESRSSRSVLRAKSKQKREENNHWALSRLQVPSREGGETQEINTQVDLSQLDRLWKNQTGEDSLTQSREETMEESRNRKESVLDPSLTISGVVYRPPSLDTLVRDRMQEPETGIIFPGKSFDNPKLRYDNREYAEMSCRLLKSLGRTRAFVAAEFFYSDLDREWYNHNPFVSLFAGIGIPENAQLSNGEWKTLRRLLNPKPRRFSKQFIASQLNDRNLYRCTVRKLQHRPRSSAPGGFPFDVYAPIAVGSIVTAYCKRYRAIQRGRILAYDKTSASYFVEFEHKHFGHEVCPDSDVATSGIPKLLAKAPFHPGLEYHVSRCQIGRPSVASATGPFAVSVDPANIRSVFDSMVSQGLSPGKPRHSQKKIGFSIEEVVDHDAFIELLDVLDFARHCWTQVLDIEEQLRSQEEMDSTGILHLQWLLSIKGKIACVFDKGIKYQRALFGQGVEDAQLDSGRGVQKSLLDRLLSECAYQEDQESSYHVTWPSSLEEVSAFLGHDVIMKYAAKEASEKVTKPSSMARLSESAHLLATANLAGQLLSLDQSIGPSDLTRAFGGIEVLQMMATRTDKLLEMKFPKPSAPSHVYNGVFSAREMAAKELQEAVACLQAEFSIAHFNDQKIS